MLKKSVGIFLLLCAVPAFGQKTPEPALKSASVEFISEADEAYQDFDWHQLSINPNNLTAEKIRDLRQNFYPAVKPLIVERGKSVARLARIAEPIFDFHRSGKSQTIVFEHSSPMVFTWQETFVCFSTGALDLLSDDETAALVAHEVGHLYFAAALSQAREAKNDRLARVIELQCDLVALTTLLNLHIKPGKLMSAVKKLIERRDELKIGSFEAGSATLESREEILRLYLSARKPPASQ